VACIAKDLESRFVEKTSIRGLTLLKAFGGTLPGVAVFDDPLAELLETEFQYAASDDGSASCHREVLPALLLSEELIRLLDDFSLFQPLSDEAWAKRLPACTLAAGAFLSLEYGS